MRRTVAAVIGLVLAAPAPAWAAGAGGVDLSPVPPVVDGRAVTAFHTPLPSHGQREVTFALSNTGQQVRTVSLYATGARRAPDGSFSLQAATPYLQLPPQQVTLSPGQRRVETFRVSLQGHALPSAEQYAAVVMEVRQGSIVQRVATLVYLTPVSVLYLPPALLAVAAGLVVALAAAVVLALRRRARR